jgi:hypothetical protein
MQRMQRPSQHHQTIAWTRPKSFETDLKRQRQQRPKADAHSIELDTINRHRKQAPPSNTNQLDVIQIPLAAFITRLTIKTIGNLLHAPAQQASSNNESQQKFRR